MRRRETRRLHRLRSVRQRIARFLRALYGGSQWAPDDPRWDWPDGGVGVREPRRPRLPSLSGAVALDAPPDDRRDVWAVGREL